MTDALSTKLAAYYEAQKLVKTLENQVKKYEYLLDEYRFEEYAKVSIEIGYIDAKMDLIKAEKALDEEIKERVKCHLNR